MSAASLLGMDTQCGSACTDVQRACVETNTHAHTVTFSHIVQAESPQKTRKTNFSLDAS